jgi:hypothetical protein
MFMTSILESTELTRGVPELVQQFRLQGEFSSHRRKSAACPKFGCITRLSQWGGGGDFHVPQMISTCLPSGRRRGGGWWGVGTLFSEDKQNSVQSVDIFSIRKNVLQTCIWWSNK